MKKMLLLALWVMGSLSFVKGQNTMKRSNLWPHHIKVQYAGGIGFFSIGGGYENKKEKLEGDLYYGFVPEGIGGTAIHTLTGKLTWSALATKRIQLMEVKPLTLGLWVSHTFGKQYFLFSPKNYPFSYYKFPTALHGGMFVGGQVSTKIKTRKVGLYYELGSNEAEIISYATNIKALSLGDILHLSLGLKVGF